jgi:hypothetical protein
MATPRRPWYTILYVQVLLAIAAGILIGNASCADDDLVARTSAKFP